MVLVHKLKQMEELDLKQFREGEDDAEGEETTPIEAPEEPEAETAPAVQPEVEAEAEAEDEEGAQSDSPSASKKKGASPPRRPITRSQTTPGGLRPSFRKVHQTNESDTEQPSASPRGRGRPRGSANKGKGREVSKPTSNGPPAAGRKRPITEVESEDEGENRGPSRRRESSETDISFSLNISRANTEPPPEPAPGPSQEDTSISDASRAIRSRATLPVPVPNLTKKSRGRRVPTKTNVTEPDPSQKDARLYVCTVEGCGKCFHRGEHLKRHIRSIHTNEKPFKCTHPACDKYFNRHDNLLQHLKVHKDPALLPMARQNARGDASGSVAQPLLQVPPGFLASIPTGLFPQTGDPAVDFSTNLAIALLSTLRNSVAMVPALAAADPSSPFRNMGMEVSSLRTEMPGAAGAAGNPGPSALTPEQQLQAQQIQLQQAHQFQLDLTRQLQAQLAQAQAQSVPQAAGDVHMQAPQQAPMLPMGPAFSLPIAPQAAAPVPVAVSVPMPTQDHDIDPSLPRTQPAAPAAPAAAAAPTTVKAGEGQSQAPPAPEQMQDVQNENESAIVAAELTGRSSEASTPAAGGTPPPEQPMQVDAPSDQMQVDANQSATKA